MPFVIPLLAATASFFGGAYIGTVVQNATENPSVNIQSATVQEKNTPLSKRDFLIAGALGVGAYLIYRKFWRR